jgi:outer membrane protein assembly factor BamA
LGIFGQLKLFGWPGRAMGRGGGAFTWAQSFRAALLEPYDSTEIPTSERLRAGGEHSVRGYRTESLGPLDDEGNALGGEVLFIVNQELRFPLQRDWLSGLVFFDAGNVWESRESIDSGLFKSVGLGLRALTPAGPLRFDVAFPLDRRVGDDRVKVYFGFGHVF